ncbi:MAG: MMPL family transporter [Agarilytica sp.]
MPAANSATSFTQTTTLTATLKDNLIWQAYNLNRSTVSTLLRFCQLAFLLLLLGVATAAYKTLSTGFSIETNLNALIPGHQKKAVQKSLERIQLNSGNKAILMLSSDDQQSLEHFTDEVSSAIEQTNTLTLADLKAEQSAVFSLMDTLRQYPFNFLSSKQQRFLENNKKKQLLANETSKFFDIGAAQGVLSPSEDPISLINDWFLEAYTAHTPIELSGEYNYLSPELAQKRFNILLMIKPVTSSLDIKTMEGANTLMEYLEKIRPDGVEIYRSGVIFHAAESATKAKRDIQLIALGSTIGIVILFLLYFGSIKPLAFSLGSIAFACISATLLTHVTFGKLHLFTLVFGASLIGITVDYSLHFFTKRYQHSSKNPSNNNSRSAIQSIFSAIFLGLASSVIGFSSLLFSSLPSLDQIATFCIYGLGAAWLFVCVVYPHYKKSHKHIKDTASKRLISDIAIAPQNLLRNLSKNTLLATSGLALLVLFPLCIVLITWSNDIRTLNSSSDELLQEEIVVRKTLNLPSLSQYLLIQESTANTVLESEEKIGEALAALIQSGDLESYQAISQYIPSLSKQEANRKIIHSQLLSEDHALSKFMSSIGFSKEHIDSYTQRYANAETNGSNNYLSISAWLESAPQDLQTLWLGKIDNKFSSIILLKGLNNPHILEPLAEKHSQHFIDNINDISRSLAQQRHQAITLLIIAYVVIAVFLVGIYRSINKLSLVSIPAISSLLTLIGLSLFNVDINLFHVFGLFLIVGLGMDYSIFISQSHGEDKACTSAIFLSAMTSILSFGLLSFSQIPMLQSFGITVLLGSLFNLLLAPLALAGRSSLSNQAIN